MGERLRRGFALMRSGDWLDRGRMRGYTRLILLIELVGFLFFVAGTHGLIVRLDRPTTTDFVSFYAAGALADAGTPALTYDRAAHRASEERVRQPGIDYIYFFYPPVYLLVCALLALAPYLAAFILFEAVTLAAFLWVAARTAGHRDAVIAMLAFPALWWNIGLGQNAFLTAALLGAGLLLVDRRPLLAGLLFGAICYKPHLGLLIPVALVAGGHWRAFAAAAASVAGWVALSLACFGAATWRAFLATALTAHATYDAGRIDFGMLVSPFGGTLLLHGSPSLGYAVQAVATLLAAALVALVWRRRLSLPVRAAVLAAAAPMAVPVVLTYDLVLSAIAALWLVRAGRETGFLPWEKTVLAALFLVPLLQRGLGQGAHVPIGPCAVVALVALVAARAVHELMQQGLTFPRFLAGRRAA